MLDSRYQRVFALDIGRIEKTSTTQFGPSKVYHTIRVGAYRQWVTWRVYEWKWPPFIANLYNNVDKVNSAEQTPANSQNGHTDILLYMYA